MRNTDKGVTIHLHVPSRTQVLNNTLIYLSVIPVVDKTKRAVTGSKSCFSGLRVL